MFSAGIIALKEQGDSGRSVFSMVNRNICVLEPGVGL
jgi:hypothetical protein